MGGFFDGLKQRELGAQSIDLSRWLQIQQIVVKISHDDYFTNIGIYREGNRVFNIRKVIVIRIRRSIKQAK